MNKIVQNFDNSVHGYEIHAVPQDALAAKLAHWIPLEERSGYAVEFGAGTGLFTRKLQPWAGAYLATDDAPRMVRTGIERVSVVAWKEHEAHDPQSLGHPDWVLACNLLQWLDDPENVLATWRSILKPGGHLVMAVLLPGTLAELRKVLPEGSPLIWRTVEQWTQLVEQAGFIIERSETWHHTHVYRNALFFFRAIHAMGLAPRRTIGPGRLRASIKEYDRKFAVASGVRSTWEGWLVRAVVP